MLSTKKHSEINIWTIGHSTRNIKEFIEILKSFNIQTLTDVRSMPGSRRYPHFNSDSLSKFLMADKINYIHMPELGGRRKAKENSENTVWRNKSFRGYADYMETAEFRDGIEKLLGIAKKSNTVIMCAEAYWRKCHRSMISDRLKSLGVMVIHITGVGKSEEHSFTEPAKVIQGELNYK